MTLVACKKCKRLEVAAEGHALRHMPRCGKCGQRNWRFVTDDEAEKRFRLFACEACREIVMFTADSDPEAFAWCPRCEESALKRMSMAEFHASTLVGRPQAAVAALGFGGPAIVQYSRFQNFEAGVITNSDLTIRRTSFDNVSRPVIGVDEPDIDSEDIADDR